MNRYAQAQALNVTEKRQSRSVSRQRIRLDLPLLISSLSLLALGLVMVGSASTSIAEDHSGEAFYYMWRQLSYLAVAFVSAFLIFMIPLKFWQRSGPTLMLINVVMLLLVFIPGLGREVNGSMRWIHLGPINLQLSELVKLFVIFYLAGYLVRHAEAVQTSAGGFLRPLMLLVVLAMLLLLQPDFGAVAVMLMTAMIMMWLGGARLFQFLLLMLFFVAALTLLVFISPYRMERLTGFMNPWADPFDSGFQLTQALIAFGRGEWFGVGLGASVQKLFYLPEAHTDFLFAVIAEELGLFGVLLVISLFIVIILRSLKIARDAENQNNFFNAYIAYGIGVWIGLQAFINIGVNMGVLPTKGLTLPLMSYGGSSLLVMCIAIAILFRVEYETQKKIYGAAPAKKQRRDQMNKNMNKLQVPV